MVTTVKARWWLCEIWFAIPSTLVFIMKYNFWFKRNRKEQRTVYILPHPEHCWVRGKRHLSGNEAFPAVTSSYRSPNLAVELTKPPHEIRHTSKATEDLEVLMEMTINWNGRKQSWLMVWCQGGVQRSSSEHRTLRHSETSQNPNSDHMACSRIHWPDHHPPLLCRACLPSTGPPKSRLLHLLCTLLPAQPWDRHLHVLLLAAQLPPWPLEGVRALWRPTPSFAAEVPVGAAVNSQVFAQTPP